MSADLAVVRTLAHPVRLGILELLQAQQTATATECAREIGESPQTCSYHLRTLAKSGFVRRVGSEDGRETRWRLVRKNVELSTTSASSPAYVAAANVLQRHVLERDERAVADFLRHEDELGDEWRKAAAFTSGSIVATPADLVQLTREIRAVLRRYESRRRKSKDARRVHVVFRAVPRIEKKGRT